MKLKRDKVKELMKEYCGGNYNRFARELGVDPSQLHSAITSGIGGGSKIIGAIILFCDQKGVDFREYVELP